MRTRYLIIGAGMTGDAAARGIREVDPDGTIGLIGAEPHAPYNRPPLSKGLWKGAKPATIERPAVPGVERKTGVTIEHVDPANRQVTDDHGVSHGYDKLLLATGGAPRRLPFGGDEIIYFRTRDDYDRLRALTRTGDEFAVIGGGFIGSEIAAALAMNGKKVVMAFPDSGIGSRIFPPDLSSFLNEYFRDKGVEVLSGATATGFDPRGSRPALEIQDARTKAVRRIETDGVVAGIGIVPNVRLAEEAGLEIEDGIRVNRTLQTSHPDIFAAGDVASFENPALDRRIRVEHEDNANTMGRLAGHAMAGRAVDYDHLPFFYSDLFDLGYEAVGETDPRLETVSDWKEPYREGVVYYLHEGRVRGVLLWNVWDQVDAARRLIASKDTFRPEELRGRLPAKE